MRKIVVQKFGGTSVATSESRAYVIGHIKRALDEGLRPAVVVSAMGRKGDPYATDTLLDLIGDAAGEAEMRDADMLMACGEVISTVVLAHEIRRSGLKAQSMTGADAGVMTDGVHGDARIVGVQPDRVLAAIDAGVIPVIAGFQGQGPDGDVTTLGRGGSDTTAAALAVSLNASALHVYTDVDGIKTADPKLAPDAVTLDRVDFRELVELAHLGAKVIHPRAVEIAMNGRLPLEIRPTYSDAAGTAVAHGRSTNGAEKTPADRPVVGIAHVAGRAQVKVRVDQDDAEAAVRLFGALGQAGISADMIYVSPETIAFIAEGKTAPQIEEILKQSGYAYQVRKDVAKVSAVGAGMHGVPGVMARVAGALAKAGIPIFQTTDSHANISCLVPEERMREAVLALHEEFDLGSLRTERRETGSRRSEIE